MLLSVTGDRLTDPNHYDGLTDILIGSGHFAEIVKGRAAFNGKRASINRRPGLENIDA